ncbi:MAG: Gfo/Idh/MocA family oxidoreductase [Cytophagales bacterium]|nr:Gfo/Idh/MocA family oxidoreductase [Armatimonadota bacterium]
MSEKIGVGIIGANPDRGWALTAHLPALAALPQYELRAVGTSRRETADAAAAKFGALLAFANYAELVRHPDIDLVTVSVKVPNHREIVLAALEAGKHVYCEWPLGNGLAEAVEMADLARRKNVHAVIGLQGRVSPWINRIRDLVAGGYVGQVLSTSVVVSGEVFGESIESANAYLFERRNGANLLTVMVGHFADTLCFCLGEFQALTAITATQRATVTIRETGDRVPVTVPDQIALSGSLVSGATASLHMRGGHSRGANLFWEINGTEGDLQITADMGFVHFRELTLQGGRGEETGLSPLTVGDEYRWAPDTLRGPAFNVAQLYVQLARDIREGTNCCADFDAAVVRHRMLDAIQASADTGTRQGYQTDL